LKQKYFMNCDVPELWIEHKNALRNFILKRVTDKEEANDIDILQDVLMKVYTFCTSKSGVSNVRSWLFQIAQNTIVDRVRKKHPFESREELPDIVEPNHQNAYIQAAEFILPMIKLLPPEYAVPLSLSDIEGVKHAEIAERLQLGLPATKSRIQRARVMLKEIFVECCIMETSRDGKLISFDIKAGCKPLQEHKKKFNSF
jgi:RNA polymerase sigma-70 factor, ECF subfamily